jgi:hypothetical protein
MHSLRAVLFLFSLFAAVALSSPTPTRTLNKRSFQHHVKRTINRRDPATGPNAMAAAYRKFGFTLPVRAANITTGGNTTAGGTGSGVVAAAPEPNNAEYLSPVNIGGQTVTLDFDTGSSDLYVSFNVPIT